MSAHDNHGQTPAAWTAVSVMIVGFVVGGIAVVIAQPWLFAVGVAVILLGAIVGKVLAMMGFGEPPGFHDGDNAAGPLDREAHLDHDSAPYQTGEHAPGTTGEHVQD